MYADNKDLEVIDISQLLIFSHPGDYVGRVKIIVSQLAQHKYLENNGGFWRIGGIFQTPGCPVPLRMESHHSQL